MLVKRVVEVWGRLRLRTWGVERLPLLHCSAKLREVEGFLLPIHIAPKRLHLQARFRQKRRTPPFLGTHNRTAQKTFLPLFHPNPFKSSLERECLVPCSSLPCPNKNIQYTHPGRYYGVLRSTRVVPVIFKRKISGIRYFRYKQKVSDCLPPRILMQKKHWFIFFGP